MNEQVKNQYDSLYGNTDNVFYEGKPLEQVERLTEHLSDGRVLDVGGGEGRNALYLAEKGFSVTVQDLSQVGLDKLLVEAKKKDLQVKTVVSDIIEEGVAEECEIIIFSFVLFHIDTADVEALIAEAKERTTPGGIHIIATFLNDGELYERSLKTNRFYPSEEDLRSLYRDWEIIDTEVEDIECHARHKDGSRMKNMAIYLTVRKPEVINEPGPE